LQEILQGFIFRTIKMRAKEKGINVVYYFISSSHKFVLIFLCIHI